MKPTLLKLISVITFAAIPPTFAHQDIKIGPNGGRLFALESKTTPQMEVGAKDGKFVIHLLDSAGRPLPIGERILTVTAGARSKPETLVVERRETTFVAAIPKGDEFPVVFQLRETKGAKPLTARMNYDGKTCGECKKPEWLCSCGYTRTK
jgi:hypothetical protein